MKNLYFLSFVILTQVCAAQTTINFDANETFVGYMSVDNPLGGFEGGWGVSDLIVDVNPGDNTATLRPNRINDLAEPYWFDDSANDLLGNGTMNASFFVEDQSGTLAATNFNFVGTISSYTLDPQWTVTAFIKVFSAGFSSLLFETYVPITSSGDFSVGYDGLAGGLIVQYGFLTIGPNVNPQSSFDGQYNALGNVVVTAATLSAHTNGMDAIKAYPNPSVSFWTIENRLQNIQRIELFDVTGKQVLTQEVTDQEEIIINAENLIKGLYLGKVKTAKGITSIKLVKE